MPDATKKELKVLNNRLTDVVLHALDANKKEFKELKAL